MNLQRLAIYVGGFVGPFTGQTLAVILPEFGQSFGISLSQARWTLTAYLLPFALVMLFSTHLIKNLPPSRVIMWAYWFMVADCVVLIVSPSWVVFVIGYCLMGIANAFTTPVFQIVLQHITPPEKLGSALGTYTAMQSSGIFFAPLAAGVLVLFNWRYLFVFSLVCMVLIVVVRVPFVPAEVKTAEHTGVDWKNATAGMVGCFAVGFSVVGLGFLTALFAGDQFGLTPPQKGFVVMCGGLAAFIFSRPLGALSDRIGVKTVLVGSLVVSAVGLAVIPVTPHAVVLGLVWGVCVLAAQGAQTAVNVLTLRGRGGRQVISTVQAFRHFGTSSAPALMLPVYTASQGLGFWVPAAIVVAAMVSQLALRR